MGFVNRVATGVLSLMFVSAVLVAGHWVARPRQRHLEFAGPERAADWSPATCSMPGCKMPDCPPASGPLTRVGTTREAGAPSAWDQSETLHSASREPSPVIHAISGREPAGSDRAPSRAADASESSALPSFPQPLPLPVRTDAIPLRPEGPELPSIGELPGSAPASPGLGSPGLRIIERALPNSSTEEREVWHDALKDLSPKDVRELMRLREELGRMPPPSFDSRAPVGQPLWPQPVPGPIASEPLAPSGDSPALLPDSEREASRTIASSLDAITRAQQVLLNNVANASTDGYKRLVIALEGVPNVPSSRHGSVGVGVRLGPAIVDMSQGKIRHTDRPLDLAIEGDGFFQLEDVHRGQIFYTRCGRFAVNAKGEMVWRTSLRELQLRPTVTITGTESEIEISSDGTVRTAGASSAAAVPGTAGSVQKHSAQVQIVRLSAMADLIPTGDNLFAIRGELQPGRASGSAALTGRLRQGCLEESNVDVDRELQGLERLRRQAHALEMAAQSLPFGSRDSLNPPSDATTIPSHFAGALGLQPR